MSGAVKQRKSELEMIPVSFSLFLYFSFLCYISYFVIINFYFSIIVFTIFFMKISCIFSFSGIFRDVPECSVFRVSALIITITKLSNLIGFQLP